MYSYGPYQGLLKQQALTLKQDGGQSRRSYHGNRNWNNSDLKLKHCNHYVTLFI